MGQESNLRPAVWEPAAVRSAPFRDVQGRTRAPLKPPFLMVQSVRTFTNVHQRSPTSTSVGVKSTWRHPSLPLDQSWEPAQRNTLERQTQCIQQMAPSHLPHHPVSASGLRTPNWRAYPHNASEQLLLGALDNLPAKCVQWLHGCQSGHASGNVQYAALPIQWHGR